MGKVSTNAGKAFYLRSDHQHLFKNKKRSDDFKKLLPINEITSVSFKTVVDTGYCDSALQILYFGDEVNYNQNKYIIDYDGKGFDWIIRSIDGKRHKLSEVCTKLIIIKKYAFR